MLGRPAIMIMHPCVFSDTVFMSLLGCVYPCRADQDILYAHAAVQSTFGWEFHVAGHPAQQKLQLLAANPCLWTRLARLSRLDLPLQLCGAGNVSILRMLVFVGWNVHKLWRDEEAYIWMGVDGNNCIVTLGVFSKANLLAIHQFADCQCP